jgi:predicted lipoprotein with Yx(FWY)xxD motif
MTSKRLPLLTVIVAIIAIVAVITATSGGAQRRTPQAAAAGSAISVAQTPVGKALVDANGRTLYLFLDDKPNVSRLSAAGQAVWPPFTSTTTPAAKGGASAAQIGIITATRQITYNGHPLYYYVGDQRPGQTAGQGLNEFGARWYVLSASGAAITSTAPTASQEGTTSPAGEGAGSGY